MIMINLMLYSHFEETEFVQTNGVCSKWKSQHRFSFQKMWTHYTYKYSCKGYMCMCMIYMNMCVPSTSSFNLKNLSKIIILKMFDFTSKCKIYKKFQIWISSIPLSIKFYTDYLTSLNGMLTHFLKNGYSNNTTSIELLLG